MSESSDSIYGGASLLGILGYRHSAPNRALFPSLLTVVGIRKMIYNTITARAKKSGAGRRGGRPGGNPLHVWLARRFWTPPGNLRPDGFFPGYHPGPPAPSQHDLLENGRPASWPPAEASGPKRRWASAPPLAGVSTRRHSPLLKHAPSSLHVEPIFTPTDSSAPKKPRLPRWRPIPERWRCRGESISPSIAK